MRIDVRVIIAVIRVDFHLDGPLGFQNAIDDLLIDDFVFVIHGQARLEGIGAVPDVVLIDLLASTGKVAY